MSQILYHQSTVILDYVKSDGGYLILKPRIEIPISPEKVQGFLDGAMIVRR
jgi:hypothetical protein